MYGRKTTRHKRTRRKLTRHRRKTYRRKTTRHRKNIRGGGVTPIINRENEFGFEPSRSPNYGFPGEKIVPFGHHYVKETPRPRVKTIKPTPPPLARRNHTPRNPVGLHPDLAIRPGEENNEAHKKFRQNPNFG